MTQPANQKAYRGRKKAKGDSRNDVWLSASLTALLDAYRAETGVSRAEGIRDLLAERLKLEPVGGRARKRQDPKKFPPSMTPDQIEALIDKVCGCGGKYNCDCISCFNKAAIEAWTEHNTKAMMTERESLK